MKPLLCVIVPCYNEEEVLEVTTAKLKKVIEQCIQKDLICENSFIRYIDDGSSDNTWQIIEEECKKSLLVSGIKLSRNFGHQNALLAGMMSVRDVADCILSIDADLQQDENCIPDFVNKYMEGNDIVIGVRKNRQTDSFFKRFFANCYYGFLNILGVKIQRNHSDYRLISKKAMESLSDFSETALFLRGIFPLLGYKQAIVYHDVGKRTAGKSKYNYRKMISLAINGVTSFSIVPMRIISFIGLFIFMVSLGMSAYVLITFINGAAIPGWSSTILPIYLIGGIQLLCIGVVGEYIGKIYLEVKKRPRYIIEKETTK